MKTPNNQLQLACLTDHTIDEIMERHVMIVTSPREEPDPENGYLEKLSDEDRGKRFPIWMPAFKVVEEGRPAPRKSVLYPKYVFLLHVFISTCRSRHYGEARFNHDKLREILGKHYDDMLTTLHLMHIIYVFNDYIPGKQSRNISLEDWSIGYKACKNEKVMEYLAEYDKHLKKIEKDKQVKIDEQVGKCFVRQYNKCLAQLELIRKDEAFAYANNKVFNSPQSEHFYKACLENFKQGSCRITSVDYRGRIYHYLTNCPSELRRFFNIKYSLDIRNSQPLLFCDFLIKHYNIDYKIIKYLREISDDIIVNDGNIIYYDGKQLKKFLKARWLCGDLLRGMPDDVLSYIYACLHGYFWDSFVTTFHELDRGEVKETLFAEVFYSHTRTMHKKKFGKVFAMVYPSVWQLIRELKKDAEQLCDRITKVESKLFHRILERCFENGWVVTSIHDEVVILNVPENVSLNVDDVRTIILDEYRKHGLLPTVNLKSY